MRSIQLLTATVIVLSLGACSSSSKKKEVKDAPSAGYQSFSSGSFQLFPVKEVKLENGLKIVFIHDTSLPRISLTTLIRTGVTQDPKGKEGLNSLTAYLLEQGTQTKNALQIADTFGQMGTELNIMPSSETTLIFSDALSTSADDLLKAYTDILMNPAFNEVEIRRMKAQMVASLQKKVDNPSSFASEEYEEIIFGTNAYGRDETGTLESLPKITKQDVIRQYLTFFRPNNASLAVVGNYDADFEEKIKGAFGKWTKRKIPAVTQEKIPAISGVSVAFLGKKNLQQTQIRLGQLGIKRNDPDFLKLRVANEVLGGGFSSRLNQRVRDDLGLTYSIGSSYQSYADAGIFTVSTFTKNESVGKTLDESLKVIQEFADKGISEKELEAAKSQLVGQFPQAIETADKTAFNLLMLDFYGIPVSYLTDYNKTIESFSLSDINKTIRRRLDPKNLKIVIYGDPKVLPQLEGYKVEQKTVK